MTGYNSLPSGYDAWRLGGDPHTGTAEVQCSNEDCEKYARKQEVPAHIEYGTVADYNEICGTCFEYSLISWGESLPVKCADCHALEDDCICEVEIPTQEKVEAIR
jgi:hypothetical protein